MKIKSFWNDGPAISEDCDSCGLHTICKSPFSKHYGNGRLNTLIVTGKPSAIEDSKGFGFSGETMESLKEFFSSVGVNLENNFWKTSAVSCYCKGELKDDHILKCKPNLIDKIRELKPKYILTVGNAATKAILGKIGRKTPALETLVMRAIPVHEYGAWVLPMLNPGKMKTENQKAYFGRLVKFVMAEIKQKKELVQVNPFENVKVLIEYKDIINGLEDLLSDSDFISSIDIEGTGLKPQYEKHCITSVGISTRKGTIAFPLDHSEVTFSDQAYENIIELLVEYLEREDIKKIAHKLQFDTMWLETILGCTVNGWLQCTNINQHLLDHRTGAKGLKELCFLKWGIRDYDKKADKYIEADRQGAKELNRMREMPLYDQLLYVGADAYLTLKLSDAEDEEYRQLDSKKKYYPRILFTESARTLCTMQENGIPINVEYYIKAEAEVTGKIQELEEKIANEPYAKKFTNLYRKKFEHSKPADLKRLFFEVMKLDAKKLGTTDGGNISLDEKALKDIGLPICEDILSLRKLLKVRDTYISQFVREEVNGKIHPFFNLTIARSFRSSANLPSFQNIPKRDDYAKKITRTGIVTEPDGGIGEIDFSGVEVCTSAAYHKDPNFIAYLTVDGSDMHRDNACDIWQVRKENLDENGKIRFYIKNQWTFPQFYGDYWGSCGPTLWETAIEKEKFVLRNGTPLVEHMHDKGIHNVDDFLKHCKKAEEKMWNERFKVYTAWKKEVNDFYIKYGYVETYLGFRFYGLLDRKQTTNYPIQGTAFHILLWSINRIQAFIKKEKLRSYLCGQIHDSCVFQWYPDERDYLLTEMNEICSKRVLKEFEWINVPFKIDVELSKVNGNFAELTKYVKSGDAWIEKPKK